MTSRENDLKRIDLIMIWPVIINFIPFKYFVTECMTTSAPRDSGRWKGIKKHHENITEILGDFRTLVVTIKPLLRSCETFVWQSMIDQFQTINLMVFILHSCVINTENTKLDPYVFCWSCIKASAVTLSLTCLCSAGLKHRSQVRSQVRSGQVAGQVRSG